jgi:hypothetical protein
MLCACAIVPSASVAQGMRATDDSVFAVVLKALIPDTLLGAQVVRLPVDPRPLRSDGGIVTVDDRTFAPVSSAALEKRVTIVRDLGITSGDASFPADCAGTMVPDTPSRLAHKGCPQTPRLLAAVALPRLGDADSKQSKPDPRFRTVRVIVTGLGSEGVNAEARDYVLETSSGQWKVVRMVPRGYWE